MLHQDLRATFLKVCLSILVLLVNTSEGGITPLDYPAEMMQCFDDIDFCDFEIIGESGVTQCVQHYLWRTAAERWHQTCSNETDEYATKLWDRYLGDDYRNNNNTYHSRTKRQAGSCRRQEVRQLSPNQWDEVARCFNRLRERGVYYRLASVHNGFADQGAHRGQAFLAWHTGYTLLLEFEMKEHCGGNICLPYWDPRLDVDLQDPRESVFFDLIGGSSGQLRRPFEQFRFRNRPLMRLMQPTGNDMLTSYSDYNRILSARSTSDISPARSWGSMNIEQNHNDLHNVMGGTMRGLESAPHDPLFFLLHSWIECIFHNVLLRLPASERRRYPAGSYPTAHRPNDRMRNLGRIQGEYLNNSNAYEPRIRQLISYAPFPSCSNNCATEGGYLYCCRGRCVSKIMKNGQMTADERLCPESTAPPPSPPTQPPPMPPTRPPSRPPTRPTPRPPTRPQPRPPSTPPTRPTPRPPTRPQPRPPSTPSARPPPRAPTRPRRRRRVVRFRPRRTRRRTRRRFIGRKKRSADENNDYNESSNEYKDTNKLKDVNYNDLLYEIKEPSLVQNDYILNGVADSSLWGYVAVNLVRYRDKDDKYESYPIKNGEFDRYADIYNPLGYTGLNNTIKPCNKKRLKRCKPSKCGMGYVYINTYGKNYNGHYTDYAFIDERLPVYSSTAYVAIKKPTKQSPTDVIFTAYDECGRVCRPMCPILGTSPPQYEESSGIVRIDADPPYLYAANIADAVKMYWELEKGLPTYRQTPYCMTFICDGRYEFPRSEGKRP